jgi:hypothetical protein
MIVSINAMATDLNEDVVFKKGTISTILVDWSEFATSYYNKRLHNHYMSLSNESEMPIKVSNICYRFSGGTGIFLDNKKETLKPQQILGFYNRHQTSTDDLVQIESLQIKLPGQNPFIIKIPQRACDITNDSEYIRFLFSNFRTLKIINDPNQEPVRILGVGEMRGAVQVNIAQNTL